MAVITISREYGSGGDEIAQQICHHFKYQFFNKRMILKAALDAGISDQEVIDYSEENYRVRRFLDRLFTSMTQPRPVSVVGEDQNIRLSEEGALVLVQKAILNAYMNGNLVILGRGGQVILKDMPGVLHLRIIAPMEERIKRVQETAKNNHDAQALILDRDAASADYLRRYYNVDWTDPLLYHMVLNTSKVAIDQATEMIIRMIYHLQDQEENYSVKQPEI